MTSQPQAEALPLWPDEVDVELPLEPADDLDARILEAQDLEAQLATLRRALADATDAYVDAIELGRTAPAGRYATWRKLAGLAYDADATPEERRDEGIARAAAKWTDEEVALVDAAIRTVAARKLDEWSGCDGARFALELTTADVWQELAGRVPVTKGIAGRMLAAKAAGIIVNTGTTVIAPRESTGPNHGQRLTVWRAL